MECVKTVLLQDEIKGRECSEYVNEFCPKRLLLSERIFSAEKDGGEADDSQFSL